MATVITHIYNEEYLLPFWLQHHRNIFSNGIIIDYKSNDKSLDICKQYCPNWTIITSKNDFFDAPKVDEEVMEIERTIHGSPVIALTCTEFLMTEDVNNIYIPNNTGMYIRSYTMAILEHTYPQTLYELFSRLYEVKYMEITPRLLHSFKDGNYSVGRHSTYHDNILTSNNIAILKFNFYPWNEIVIKRRLSFNKKIPDSNKIVGWGFQHFWDEQEMNKELINIFNIGSNINELNLNLNKIITTIINTIPIEKFSTCYWCSL